MFREGAIRTLDAGCGNGCLGYAAHRLGNKVLGVSLDADQIARNREFYRWKRSSEIEFQVCNLYELHKLGRQFDQIICSETLEHITKDRDVMRIFAQILTDNGVLHLCCPYAFHPEHKLGRTNEPENGDHVRDGYTLESYKALLESAGFTIVSHMGLGSNVLCRTDQVIRVIRNHFGDVSALPIYLLVGWLALLLDDRIEPKVPYSLYVQGVKKA